MHILLILLLSLCLTQDVYSETLRARVVAVADGDTITVLDDRRRQQRIRLIGIDAPERQQAYSSNAKSALASLVFGKVVEIQWEKRDRYKRLLGIVYTDDGLNVNEEMLKRGLAWWYRGDSPQEETLKRLEERARLEKRGLWSDPHPVEPWIFRRTGGPNMQELYTKGVIIGNRRSRIYHTPGCSTYSRVSEKHRRLFSSEEEALRAGYRKAKNCD